MFRFKQFDIVDEHTAMKVGTDGVLLGAWADVEGDSRILDLGTGSGIIALMAAQRNAEAEVVGLDIDEGALLDARHNGHRSPWSERLEFVLGDVAQYITEGRFDHIISNPPYFVDSLHSPDKQRTAARHTSSLKFSTIVDAAERLLNRGGKLSVVLPTDVAMQFRREAFERMKLTRLVDVITNYREAPKRTMMEFRLTEEYPMPRCTTMAIYDADGSYSSDYRSMTKDFYLKF